MDQHHVTDLKRSLSSVPSRRDILRGPAGAGLGFGVLAHADTVEAKNKKRNGRKRKNKKQDQVLIPAAETPLPPPASPPPLPHAGNCSLQRNRCTALDPVLASCNPTNEFATCLVTFEGKPFCGSILGFKPEVHCRACRLDSDCTDIGFPPGSACVQLGGQFCNGCESTQNRACFPPAIPV